MEQKLFYHEIKNLHLISFFLSELHICRCARLPDSFTGTGASTSVADVRVENLTQAKSLTINGSDILRLRM